MSELVGMDPCRHEELRSCRPVSRRAGASSHPGAPAPPATNTRMSITFLIAELFTGIWDETARL